MKIYLIAALFLGALVVAHSLEEDEKVELPEAPDQPKEDSADPPDGTEGDNKGMADPPDGTEGDMEADTSVEELTKRRLRDILSSYSCGLLYRRGLCKYAFIKNLCRNTCKEQCRDRLSRASCHRLKHTFHRCNTPFGRFFCEHTCGCVPSGCKHYLVLNQRNRRQSRPRGNLLLCDQRRFSTRWYRFTGLAGDRMPTRAPPKNRCGTHAPGWMVGSYPVLRGQIARRKVCYHWGKNKCAWSNYIKVKNCGRYFLFFLRPTPACPLRYCGNA